MAEGAGKNTHYSTRKSRTLPVLKTQRRLLSRSNWRMSEKRNWRAPSQFSEASPLSQYQPEEVAVFDHYAPRIGPLQIGASLLLVALGFWAITFLVR